MSSNKTSVHFRIFKDGDVIALFPDESWDFKGNIASYARIGQHSGASPELMDELPAATPEQYGELKAELEHIGYELEVLA